MPRMVNPAVPSVVYLRASLYSPAEGCAMVIRCLPPEVKEDEEDKEDKEDAGDEEGEEYSKKKKGGKG